MARTTMQLHTARSAQTFCAASACSEAHTAVLAMDAVSASIFVYMDRIMICRPGGPQVRFPV